MNKLVSLQQLAWSIRVPLSELKRIADEAQENWRSHYDHFAKKTGPEKVRMLYPPKPRLKEIQRRLNRHVLCQLDFGPKAHGSIAGRSPETNARPHGGAAKVVTNDIKAFFPSVRHRVVFRMLRDDHGFGNDVASLVTRLTTVEGRLREGAPTSSTLANLVLAKSLDAKLEPDLQRTGTTYTRYVDDMAFSGDNPLPLITASAKLLSKSGLQVHRTQNKAATSSAKKPNKLKIFASSDQQKITGLVVNGHKVGLPRQYREKLRAEIHGLSSESGEGRNLSSITSRIARVRKFHPGEGRRLQEYFDKKTAV
jgi:RNA-directed DNA polymerase